MKYKKKTLWLVSATALYALSYLIAGGIAYQLITKQFYVGDHAIFTTYLRSEANAAEWAHVSTWMFPVILLRGLLIGLVLLAFVGALERMKPTKRVIILFLFSYLLLHLAAAAPSPGNLEGFVYMKPGLMTLKTFLATQPEMLLQSGLFAAGLAWAIPKLSGKNS